MREQRLVFGEDADLYDLARPTYPAALLDDVVEMVGPSAKALDIGCGTGKATVLLAARGLGGVGVEADPAMAAVARRNLVNYQKWRVDVSDFEKWQPKGAAPFDLVCSAQAWHWLDPEVRMHRAHELLRTGGWLALWWNRPADSGDDVADGADGADRADGADGADLAHEIERIYAEVAPTIAAKSGVGHRSTPEGERSAADDIPAGLSFGVPVRRSYPWVKDYTPEEWVALLRTQSDHRLLPPAQLDELTGRIREALATKGGTYRHRYVCRMWAVQKR